MPPFVVPLIFAGLSILGHLALTAISILGIILEVKKPALSVLVLIYLVIAVIVETILLISSSYLFKGILKKLFLYIFLWLYVALAYIALSFVDLIFGYNAVGYIFPIKLAVFILHVVILYPIFAFYRDFKPRCNFRYAPSVENVESSMNHQRG